MSRGLPGVLSLLTEEGTFVLILYCILSFLRKNRNTERVFFRRICGRSPTAAQCGVAVVAVDVCARPSFRLPTRFTMQ